MKRKTIEKILSGKFHSWLNSIPDTEKELKNLIKNNTIITGGCIVSFLLDEDVNDFDLYFRDLKTTEAVAKYYVKRYLTEVKSKKPGAGISTPIEVVVKDGRIKVRIKSSGVESATSRDENYRYFEANTFRNGDPGSPDQTEFIDNAMTVLKNKSGKKYSPVFLTDNSITLSNSVQLVFRFYGEPDEIHKNYDFLHCTSYWDSATEKLTLNPNALESILTKELIYVGSLYPICSMIRTRKFIKRGWTINAGQFLKMAIQVSELNLKDPEVLMDQLIGVDVAYFHELMSVVFKEGKQDAIDSTYIMELVDKIF